MLDSGERTGLMVLSVVAVVTIIVILAVTIYSMHRNRLEDSLKRELLDRGMSADEIATIMNKSAKQVRVAEFDDVNSLRKRLIMNAV